MQLNDVGIMKLVVALDGLAVEHARTPDPSRLERMLEVPMNFPGQIQDRAADGEREGSGPIDGLSGDFRVDPEHP